MKYLLSFILVAFSLTAFSQNYTYNKKNKQIYLKKITNNKKVKKLLSQMENLNGKSKEAADKMATLAAMDQSHYSTISLAGIGYLANNGYLSNEEYSILMKLFKNGGWTSKNIAKVQNYTNYSSDVAAEVIGTITNHNTQPTPAGFTRGSLRFIGGFIGVALGLSGGPAGMAAGATIGGLLGDAAGEALEGIPATQNDGEGTGFMPGPDGQGDYRPSGGWPIVN